MTPDRHAVATAGGHGQTLVPRRDWLTCLVAVVSQAGLTRHGRCFSHRRTRPSGDSMRSAKLTLVAMLGCVAAAGAQQRDTLADRFRLPHDVAREATRLFN